MKCHSCDKTGLQPHANYPAVKLLIDPVTERPHLCSNMFSNRGKTKTIREEAKPKVIQHLYRDRQRVETPYDPEKHWYPADLFIIVGFDERGQPKWERNPWWHDKDGNYTGKQSKLCIRS